LRCRILSFRAGRRGRVLRILANAYEVVDIKKGRKISVGGQPCPPFDKLRVVSEVEPKGGLTNKDLSNRLCHV